MEGLDIKKLAARPSRIISSQVALKDLTPFDWPEEVIAGEKTVIVDSAEVDKERRCVKLGISL